MKHSQPFHNWMTVNFFLYFMRSASFCQVRHHSHTSIHLIVLGHIRGVLPNLECTLLSMQKSTQMYFDRVSLCHWRHSSLSPDRLIWSSLDSVKAHLEAMLKMCTDGEFCTLTRYEQVSFKFTDRKDTKDTIWTQWPFLWMVRTEKISVRLYFGICLIASQTSSEFSSASTSQFTALCICVLNWRLVLLLQKYSSLASCGWISWNKSSWRCPSVQICI